MLMPLRHTTEEELTEAELAELYQLKQTVLNTDYNFLMECLPKAKSIPEHHHLHLIVPKTV